MVNKLLFGTFLFTSPLAVLSSAHAMEMDGDTRPKQLRVIKAEIQNDANFLIGLSGNTLKKILAGQAENEATIQTMYMGNWHCSVKCNNLNMIEDNKLYMADQLLDQISHFYAEANITQGRDRLHFHMSASDSFMWDDMF